MQERRTLAYIDKDSIPASATAWSGETSQSVSGTVIYIPNIKMTLSSNTNINIYAEGSSAARCCDLNIGAAPYTNSYSQSGVLNLITSYNSPMLSVYSNYEFWAHLFPVVFRPGNLQTIYSWLQDPGTSALYGKYVRLEFLSAVYFGGYNSSTRQLTTVSWSNSDYPLYVGNE